MKTSTPSPAPAQWEACGLVLRHHREQQNLTCEALGKKIGLSAEQVEAIEAGRHEAFIKTAQPVWWFVRLYARKLGIDLPLNMGQAMQSNPDFSAPVKAIPAFLLKTPPNN